jgi:hypothetical protein
MTRQQLLPSAPGPLLEALMDESVLHRVVDADARTIGTCHLLRL